MSVMTIATLTCGQCGHDFPLNLWNEVSEIKCPYCNQEVEKDMINKIRSAWGTVADLNRDFLKYSSERDESLFRLNVNAVEVHLPLDDDSETE